MNKTSTALLFTLLSTFAFAQDSIAIKYGNTINAKELSKHLHVLASDEYQGRETGKEGQKMAMRYLIENFKSYGIEEGEHGFTQTFKLLEQESKNCSFSLADQKFIINQDFTLSPSITPNQTLENELVFVGYGIQDSDYDDYEGNDVKGKFVFFLEGSPAKKKLNQDWDYDKKKALAKEKGAIGIVYRSSNLESYLTKYKHQYEKARMKLKEDVEKDPFYSVVLTKIAANKVLEANGFNIKKLEKKGLGKYQSFSSAFTLEINKPSQELTSENVLAYIPGEEYKDELIVITAHYDHIGMHDSLIFNGADDDGSGTSALLEIAEAFMLAKKNGNGPKRSILIMPVSGEEKGLLGSKYYTNNPVFPLGKTVCNLNVDMIGRYDEAHINDSNYVYLIGSDKLSSELHDLSERVNSTYTKIGLDYTFNDENDPNRFYYRSDHYNFAKNNIPVIFYFNGVHEDYHKSTDTVEKIDFSKMERISRLIFYTAWEVANRKERIKLD